MKIDWLVYDETTTEIDLSYNNINEINWNNCPQNLNIIDLNFNYISEMNWENCPQSLREIYLASNKISKMNWKNCPWDIENFFNDDIKLEYENHKKSRNNIPYLPIISKDRKELIYELNHIWSLAPNGVLFKEGIKELEEMGMFQK